MARIVIVAEPGDTDSYRIWLADSIRKYFTIRPTPYNIVFISADKQDCVWHNIDNAAVTIVTEEFITHWSSDVVKRQESWSSDICNIMDTTQGDNLLVDILWFMNDLNGFLLDCHKFEVLQRMLSWQPTTKFHIIVRKQFFNAPPTFVMLLRATIHHGDDCMDSLANVIPIWRGSLLLHNSNQDLLLGGLQLDCHKNNDRTIRNNLVMEGIQVVETIPSQWVCPVEYELSTSVNRAVATFLQAIDNRYLLVRFSTADVDGHYCENSRWLIDDDQCCMMIGYNCCHANTISCKAWFLRKPDVFMPLPNTLHQLITHSRSESLTTGGGNNDVLNLKHYHHRLLLGCHELDCEQNNWPEMRLLRDKELNNDLTTTSVSVPMAATCNDNILEETNKVLSQFKHDGSCDHTSELSPVTLGCVDDVQYKMCSEGEHKLTHMDFSEACDGCYHGVSYCLNSAESQDSQLVRIQQKCVSKETQCSHDCKGKRSPQDERSHGNQQTSHSKRVKCSQPISKKKRKRSVRHKKRLQVIVLRALKERGVSRNHQCFSSCYRRLFNLSKSFLKDLHSSKNLTNEMRLITSSNVQQVIEFECRRLGITTHHNQ